MFPRALLCLCLALLPLRVFAAKPSGAGPSAAAGDYKGAIVMDASSGKVLFEENAGFVAPPASVTKLMTFLVVMDRIQAGALTLQTPVEVTAEDAKMGGTQVFLKEKEVFTVEELLYALMIQSANDAAHALARVGGGTRDAFVDLMNARAKALGMTQTRFVSPHGLPPSTRKQADSDLTSPRDLALLSRELVTHSPALRYTAVRQRFFRRGQRAELLDMRNHNHLLGKVPGVDGLKTGFTRAAGFCLAATAQRGGRRVIVVTMGSPASKTRDLAVAALIERGFAALPADALFQPGEGAAGPLISPVEETSESPLSPAADETNEESADSGEAPLIRFPPAPKK